MVIRKSANNAKYPHFSKVYKYFDLINFLKGLGMREKEHLLKLTIIFYKFQ